MNALNPYMQGRQAGTARPYAPIQAGGKIGVDALMAARQANAITPTVTQGRNVQKINIDPARDIRATGDANRLDLRARMNNDATMDMEAMRQTSQDARALTNNEFTAGQNNLNRKLEKQQLEAQHENNRLLQKGQFSENQKDRTFEASESDKRIDADLERLGISNTHAKDMQGLDITSREKMTYAELNTRVGIANKQLDLQLKELNEKIALEEKKLTSQETQSDKDRTSRENMQGKEIKSAEGMQDERIESAEGEGNANRKTQEDINSANNANRVAVGKQSDLASLNRMKEELTFKRSELKAMQDIKKAERDDKFAQGQAFGATVARKNEDWSKWQTQGKAEYRQSAEDSYMNKFGVGAIQTIQNGGDGTIDTPNGPLKPMIPDRTGQMIINPAWVNVARNKILQDPTQRSTYAAEVDRRVDRRDEANYRIWEAYQTTSARNGIPTQSTTPLTPSPGRGVPIQQGKTY